MKIKVILSMIFILSSAVSRAENASPAEQIAQAYHRLREIRENSNFGYIQTEMLLAKILELPATTGEVYVGSGIFRKKIEVNSRLTFDLVTSLYQILTEKVKSLTTLEHTLGMRNFPRAYAVNNFAQHLARFRPSIQEVNSYFVRGRFKNREIMFMMDDLLKAYALEHPAFSKILREEFERIFILSGMKENQEELFNTKHLEIDSDFHEIFQFIHLGETPQEFATKLESIGHGISDQVAYGSSGHIQYPGNFDLVGRLIASSINDRLSWLKKNASDTDLDLIWETLGTSVMKTLMHSKVGQPQSTGLVAIAANRIGHLKVSRAKAFDEVVQLIVSPNWTLTRRGVVDRYKNYLIEEFPHAADDVVRVLKDHPELIDSDLALSEAFFRTSIRGRKHGNYSMSKEAVRVLKQRRRLIELVVEGGNRLGNTDDRSAEFLFRIAALSFPESTEDWAGYFENIDAMNNTYGAQAKSFADVISIEMTENLESILELKPSNEVLARLLKRWTIYETFIDPLVYRQTRNQLVARILSQVPNLRAWKFWTAEFNFGNDSNAIDKHALSAFKVQLHNLHRFHKDFQEVGSILQELADRLSLRYRNFTKADALRSFAREYLAGLMESIHLTDSRITTPLNEAANQLNDEDFRVFSQPYLDMVAVASMIVWKLKYPGISSNEEVNTILRLNQTNPHLAKARLLTLLTRKGKTESVASIITSEENANALKNILGTDAATWIGHQKKYNGLVTIQLPHTKLGQLGLQTKHACVDYLRYVRNIMSE